MWTLHTDLEKIGEVKETTDDTLVQGVGGLHTELQQHGVDAEGEDTQEDAGGQQPDLLCWLNKHPEGEA